MQVLLRIANGKTNVRKVRLQSDTVIGRSPECQLKVASNQISRRHCQILIRDGFVAIKDLGSANGTFVNGRRVPPEVEVPLTPGTRIMLGPLHFTIDYEPVSQLSVAVVPATQDAATDTVTNASQESVAAAQPQARQPRGESAGSAAKQNSPGPGTPQTKSAPAAKLDAALSTTASSGLSDTAYTSPPVPPAEQAGQAEQADAVPNVISPVPAVTPTPRSGSGVNPPKGPTEASDHDFHFGIFAASGSGVVVESAPEIPLLREPVPIPMVSKTEKPGKRGFFQMLGWGKKNPAQPAVAPDPNDTADPALAAEPPALVADDEIELVASTDSDDDSLNVLIDDGPAPDSDGSGSSGDLNRIFN